MVSGCNFAHLAQSGGSAGAGALVTSLVTSNPAIIAGGAAVATVTTEILDPLETDDGSYDDGFEEGYEKGIKEDPGVAKTHLLVQLAEQFGWWLLIIGVPLWLFRSPLDHIVNMFTMMFRRK